MPGRTVIAMTTLENRPHTALLVIDVQNGVVAQAHNRDAVIANVASAVDKARAADVDVVWIQHSGDNLPKDSEQWQYVPELTRADARTAGPQDLWRLVRGDRPENRCSPSGASAGCSSPAPRPTSASGARCTAPSCAATT